MKAMSDLLSMPPSIYTYSPSKEFVLPSCRVGLELELENFPIKTNSLMNKLAAMWVVVRDNSLRGEHAWELKSKYPTLGKDILKSLDLVETHACRDDIPSSFHHQGERSSLHVHIDIRDLTLIQLKLFILIYTLYEHLLYGYCGKDRDNNIYCWPLHKTELSHSIINWLFETEEEDFLSTIKHSFFTDSNLKYNGMNINCLKSFGSLEFRQHPGEHRKRDIIKWINILMSMKKFSLETQLDELELLKTSGQDQACQIFGKYFDDLISHWNDELSRLGKDTCTDILNYSNYISSFGVSILPLVYCSLDNNLLIKNLEIKPSRLKVVPGSFESNAEIVIDDFINASEHLSVYLDASQKILKSI